MVAARHSATAAAAVLRLPLLVQSLLQGHEARHAELRADVVALMRRLADDFAPFVEDDESFDQYLARMQRVWCRAALRVMKCCVTSRPVSQQLLSNVTAEQHQRAPVPLCPVLFPICARRKARGVATWNCRRPACCSRHVLRSAHLLTPQGMCGGVLRCMLLCRYHLPPSLSLSLCATRTATPVL